MLDHRWQLVADIELFADLGDPDPQRVGMVRARPHPTGWFLSGHHRADLAADEVANFAEFARVRAFLLLSQGPTVATWAPGPGSDDWIAWWVVPRLEAAEQVPDAVPADWR